MAPHLLTATADSSLTESHRFAVVIEKGSGTFSWRQPRSRPLSEKAKGVDCDVEMGSGIRRDVPHVAIVRQAGSTTDPQWRHRRLRSPRNR